ncbi:MAG: hypothetical protein RL317_282 [Pseudomonadota bacterium]
MPLDEGQIGQFFDLRLGYASVCLEVEAFEDLDGRETRQSRQRGALFCQPGGLLGFQHRFEEVREATVIGVGPLGQVGQGAGYRRELQLSAQRGDAFVRKVSVAIPSSQSYTDSGCRKACGQ